MSDWTSSIDTVLCDLDGVVWLAHEPIPGSVAAVDELRRSGRRVVFVTNNSAATLDQHEEALAVVGVAARGDVISSALAAARLVEPGERVLVAAGPGVAEACRVRGAEVVVNTGGPIDGAVDAVVVGLHRDFDYDRLAVAARAARGCGRLIGTNGDSTFPTPEGLLPGGGAILAAIAVASDVEPIIAGKPHQPMASVVASLLDSGRAGFDPERVLMVGDRPETDGLFAERLGCRFALVRSGVTTTSAVVDGVHGVDLDADDLADVARRLVPRERVAQ